MPKTQYYRSVWESWDIVFLLIAALLAVFFVLMASRAAGGEPDPPRVEMIVSPWAGMFAAGEKSGIPFVEVGSHVTPETVVGLIYLDVMQPARRIEVYAGLRGTVLQVLVEDGSYVEAGQPLMMVELDREIARAIDSP